MDNKKYYTGSETVVFIDSSNIIYGGQELGFRIEHKKLYKYLTERYGASRVYYYTGIERGDNETASSLRKIGYKVRWKRIITYKNKPRHESVTCPGCDKKFVKKIDMGYRKKANCDAELTFDMIRMANIFKRAIFMTGDGDFLDPIKYLRDKRGKKITIIGAKDRTAMKLKRFAKSDFVDLASIKDIIKED